MGGSLAKLNEKAATNFVAAFQAPVSSIVGIWLAMSAELPIVHRKSGMAEGLI